MLNKYKILKYLQRYEILKQKRLWNSTNAQTVQVFNPDSLRQRQYQASREIYRDHETLLYSSHLELENLRKLRQEMFGKKKPENVKNSDDDKINLGFQGLYTNKLHEIKNWMDDYEFYEGGVDESGTIDSTYGTADPSIPPSRVPCNGCGAHLHCAKISLPGYIPKEIFAGRTDRELQTIICQRCHFLKEYNIALDIEVTPETYIETISKINDEFALAIIIVDLLDFPCSIWPGMQRILGSKRPVFIVGNKVDLLPRDSNGYLQHVKQCLKEQIQNQAGFDSLNIKNISLISAKTGYGVEELITQLHKIWKHNGNVYLMGCTNVGKSTLFNILLNSDYCRPEASDLVRKATTCPWPGTTLQMLKFPILRPSDIRVYQRFKRLFSEAGQKAAEEKLRKAQAQKTGSIQAAKLIGHVGKTFGHKEDVVDAFSAPTGTQPILTLNEKRLEYKEARWCFDTPGVMHPAQITNLLTTEELLVMQPEEIIHPRAYRLPPQSSLFLAGLGRLDFLEYSFESNLNWLKIFIFASHKLPVVIVPTKEADKAYKNYLGSEILGVPFGSKERLEKWPGLEASPQDIHIQGSEDKNILSCDITFSSAGWMGLDIPKNAQCSFKAWSPFGRGIYVRKPALIKQAERLVGKRIKYSLAYNLGRPFVFRK